MPTLVERRKATQRKALAKQRVRLRRLKNQRKSLARLRAAIRAAKWKIRKRRELIESAGKPKIHLGPPTDRATGGDMREKVVAVALAAAQAHAQGKRKSFYSQFGGWTVDYPVRGEPRGYRSDCSQFVTACYHAAGAPDPNGNNYQGGYTGTLANNGRVTKTPKPGDLGLYGTYPFHHVELYVGNGKFVGHGSPPVDQITPGWPNQFRTYL